MNKNFKTIFCGNASKNKTPEEYCTGKFKEIGFEYMSQCTPQQNGVVEWALATLYYQIHQMTRHMGLHEKLNTDIWPKCMKTVTKLENTMVNPHKENGPTRISTEICQTIHNI